MDETLQRQLVRQLKIMNTWITIFGSLMLISLVILMILVLQVVTFVRTTGEKVDNLKNSAASSLDVKKNACTADNEFGKYLREHTGLCK